MRSLYCSWNIHHIFMTSVLIATSNRFISTHPHLLNPDMTPGRCWYILQILQNHAGESYNCECEGIQHPLKAFSLIMLCKWVTDCNFNGNVFWINYTNVQQFSPPPLPPPPSLYSTGKSQMWRFLGAAVGSVMFERVWLLTSCYAADFISRHDTSK